MVAYRRLRQLQNDCVDREDKKNIVQEIQCLILLEIRQTARHTRLLNYHKEAKNEKK